MTRQTLTNKENTKRWRAAGWSSGGAALILTLLTGAAMPSTAQAQQPPAAKTPIEPTLHSIPATARPVFDRAADALRVAERGANSAPMDARASYRSAAQLLRQMLAIAGYSTQVAPSDGSAVATISPGGVRYDVRALRLAAYQSSSADAALLKRAATLYESAAQRLAQAQAREAMNPPNPNRTADLNQAARRNSDRTKAAQAAAAANNAEYSQVASNSLPPQRTSSGHGVSVRIMGNRQDQAAARQQGLQSLRDLYAPPSTTAAATVAAPGTAGAEDAALAEQNAAYNAAYQQALAQQAYLNALGVGPGITFGPNGSLFGGYPYGPFSYGAYGAYGGYPISSGPVTFVTPVLPSNPYAGLTATPGLYFLNPFGQSVNLNTPVTITPLPGTLFP